MKMKEHKSDSDECNELNIWHLMMENFIEQDWLKKKKKNNKAGVSRMWVFFLR